VSFAVLEGRSSCRFPNLPGWSAADTASRAVAEHRAWLAHTTGELPLRRLAMLLGAARAAAFFESLQRGDPELPLTAGAAGRKLGGAAEDAWASCRACRLEGARPDPSALAALEKLVRSLPSYRG
jgi:hypothetical protein